jgi:hypothetical protein
VEDLSEDLLLALYRQTPSSFVIRCRVDAAGETHGKTVDDQAALDRYNAVKDLPGFTGKGPL